MFIFCVLNCLQKTVRLVQMIPDKISERNIIMGSMRIIYIVVFASVMSYFFVTLHRKREDEKRERDYLQGKRPQLLCNCLPECSYLPEWNLNEIGNIAKIYVFGNYYKYLGCLQYQGGLNGAYVHDIISRIEHDENPDEYYENLIYEYAIPTDSPVYGLDGMEVKRKTSMARSAMNQIAKFSTKKVLNMFGVPVSKKRNIMIGDLDAAVLSSGYDTYDRWEQLLQHGLADRIREVFQMYAYSEQVLLKYDREKLYIIISMKMGDHSGFEEYNDFIVNHVELIHWTFQNMDKLCS